MTAVATHPLKPTGRRSRVYVLLLCLLAGLSPCTLDLYLPALPALQAELSASPAGAQATLTATTVGLALGYLWLGQWSDRVGRRTALLCATLIHVIASAGVALAPSLQLLLVFRLLQGAGAAGAAVVATAIAHDVFHDNGFAKTLSRVALVGSLGPVVAPFIGSLLAEHIGWRGLFGAVFAYGLVVLALVAGLLGETLGHDRRVGKGDGLRRRYAVLLREGDFLRIAIVGGMVVSGVFAYMTSSSFILLRVFELSRMEYSLVFAAGALAFAIGTQLVPRALRRCTPLGLLACSLPLLALCGFAITGSDLLGLGAPGVISGSVAFLLFSGMSASCVPVAALAHRREHIGTAASLLGAFLFGLAGVTAPLVGAIGVGSAVPMGLVMGTTGLVATCVLHIRASRED